MFGLDEYFLFQNKHAYSFAAVGLNVKEQTFRTREAANDYMHKLCLKHGLQIVRVWDDKHNKTYICNNGVRFFIQRAF